MNLTQFTPASAMPDLADYMSTRDAAKLLGFHTAAVAYMLRRKRLEGVLVGHSWLVSRKSVRAYLRKNRGLSKNDPRRKRPA